MIYLGYFDQKGVRTAGRRGGKGGIFVGGGLGLGTASVSAGVSQFAKGHKTCLQCTAVQLTGYST